MKKNQMVIWNPKTQRGKNRVREHGQFWIVVDDTAHDSIMVESLGETFKMGNTFTKDVRWVYREDVDAVVYIEDFCFFMLLCGSGDRWTPFGRVYHHPSKEDGGYVHTSSPVEYDKVNKILKTASGRVYKIRSFAEGNVEKWEKEIEDEILRIKA